MIYYVSDIRDKVCRENQSRVGGPVLKREGAEGPLKHWWLFRVIGDDLKA